MRVLRLKWPDGGVALIQPGRAGKRSGFTLLFEALMLTLGQPMLFAAVARLIGVSGHRVHAICSRCVDLAVDQTFCRHGHHDLTLAADADRRSIVFVRPGGGSDALDRPAKHREGP